MPDISKRDRGLFLAIFILALGFRIAYLVDVKDSPYAGQPLLDSYWYDDKAQAVVDGDLLSRAGPFRVPLYTYFLAACYLVFGHSFVAPLVIQAAIGAFTCSVLYLIAARLFGRLAGAYAGFGFALYRTAIYSDGEILPTTLFILFTVSAVYFGLSALERPGARDGLLAGLALGLAFLTRPEVLVFAAGLAVAVLAIKRKRGFRLVGLMGIVLLGTVMLLGVRNYMAFGRFASFSPQGAVNFYMGNAGYAEGKSPVAPPTRFPYVVTADPGEDNIDLASRQAAFEATGRRLDDRELSRYYTRKTLAEIAGAFPRWLGLMVRKAYYFLNAYELSDIKLIPRFIAKYSRVLRLPLVDFAVVMPLGLVGLGLAVAKRRQAAWLVIAGLVATTLTTLVFFVVWRFRLPAVPFLLVLGGFAVDQGVAALRARETRRVLALAVPAIALGAFSLTRFWGVRAEPAAATYIANEGALLALAGKPEEAARVYKEAVESDPTDPRPYYYLGKIYESLGRVSESKEMLERAAAVNPAYRPFSDLSIGIGLAKQGAYDQAAGYFKRAVTADPTMAVGHYNLGLAMFKLGRFAEARQALDEAVRRAGGNSDVVVSAAQILVGMGEADKAIAMAGAVLQREPRNGQAYYTLGLALESQGKTPQAIEQLERALQCMPSSQEVRQTLLELKTRQLKR